jgi:hypothetical protein
MAKPKITLAVRILLLEELLEKLRDEERDASIKAHHAFEDVRSHLIKHPPGSHHESWEGLKWRMDSTSAVAGYIRSKMDQVRDEIRLLKS